MSSPPLPYWRLSSFYFWYYAALGAFTPYFAQWLHDLGQDAIAWMRGIAGSAVAGVGINVGLTSAVTAFASASTGTTSAGSKAHRGHAMSLVLAGCFSNWRSAGFACSGWPGLAPAGDSLSYRTIRK